MIEEQDNRGGYLVSREVADAIMRIAASVGTIMNQAAKWDMTTDELGVPNYTGSFLKGAYLGVDAPGAVTGLTFGQAQLVAKKWQLAFVVGNDLLADASVNVADWLLALGGEALANMIDYQGFVGGANTGDPFLGILQLPFDDDGRRDGHESDLVRHGRQLVVGRDHVRADEGHGRQLADDRLDSKSRSSTARPSTCTAPYGPSSASRRTRPATTSCRTRDGRSRTRRCESNPGGGPIKPAGEILGYPVYTNRWLPAVGASSVNGFSRRARATRSSSSAT